MKKNSENLKTIFLDTNRFSPNDRIENMRGQRFICIGWGMGYGKIKPYESLNSCVIREYTKILSFLQFNGEGTQVSFEATEYELNEAMKRGRIKYV